MGVMRAYTTRVGGPLPSENSEIADVLHGMGPELESIRVFRRACLRPRHGRRAGDTQVYKWDDKKITVTFDGGGGGGEQVGDTPADLNDLVHGKKVGGEVDDEMASRGWKPVKTTGEDPDLYSYWSKGSRCVVVHFDAKRKVQSVATGVAADCKE